MKDADSAGEKRFHALFIRNVGFFQDKISFKNFFLSIKIQLCFLLDAQFYKIGFFPQILKRRSSAAAAFPVDIVPALPLNSVIRNSTIYFD